jgi:hypothetical protein
MNILGIDGYFLGSISLGLTIYFYEAMGDRLDVVATTIDVLVVNVTIVYAMVVGVMVSTTTMNATRGGREGRTSVGKMSEMKMYVWNGKDGGVGW